MSVLSKILSLKITRFIPEVLILCGCCTTANAIATPYIHEPQQIQQIIETHNPTSSTVSEKTDKTSNNNNTNIQTSTTRQDAKQSTIPTNKHDNNSPTKPKESKQTSTKEKPSQQEEQNNNTSSDTPIENEINHNNNENPPSLYARKAYFDYSAHDDGSIVEWNPGFFVAHDWSEPGQIITNTEIGEIIRVNDIDITITDRFLLNKNAYYEDIRNMAGSNQVIFQTCSTPSDNLILFGYSELMGPYDTFPEPTQNNEEIIYEEYEEYEEPIYEEECIVEGFISYNDTNSAIASSIIGSI